MVDDSRSVARPHHRNKPTAVRRRTLAHLNKLEALQLSRDAMASNGLITHDDNPFVIEEIIKIWETLRQLVTKEKLGDCGPFINRLYGMNQYGKALDQFRQSFEIYFDVMKLGETKGDPSKLAEMKGVMLKMIGSEIERFSRLKDSREEIDHQKIRFKEVAGVIPSGEGSDLGAKARKSKPKD